MHIAEALVDRARGSRVLAKGILLEPGRKGTSSVVAIQGWGYGISAARVRSVGTRVEGTWPGLRGSLRGGSICVGLGCSVKFAGVYPPTNGYRATTTGTGIVPRGPSPERDASWKRIPPAPPLREGRCPTHARVTGTGACGGARGSCCAAEVGRRHPVRSSERFTSSTWNLASTLSVVEMDAVG